jgi:hypothetical protein
METAHSEKQTAHFWDMPRSAVFGAANSLLTAAAPIVGPDVP